MSQEKMLRVPSSVGQKGILTMTNLDETESNPLFFIVGRGRSGTTLLSRMLAQHSELSVAPEGFFAMNLRARFGNAHWDDRTIERFCDALVLENRMKTWGLELDEVSSRLHAALPALNYQRACAVVYRCHAECTLGQPGARLFGDKNPHYSLMVGTLLKQFPDARFVHVVRDPRDNVLSFRSVPFDVNTVSGLAARWRAYNEVIERAVRTAPERFLRVRYESLVAQPTLELTRICGFLGVPFEPQLLAFFEQPQVNFYGEGSRWFSQLKQPVDGRHVNKWAQALSKGELVEIEGLCGATMKRLGYTPVTGAGLAGIPVRSLAGALRGLVGLLAERALFSALPLGLRTEVINRHRAQTGRT